MELTSQKLRKIAPELDPLRLGTGWKLEDLSKPQIMIESTFGDSHPGSGHLLDLVEEARQGVAEAGGFGARYFCTDICDGEALVGITANEERCRYLVENSVGIITAISPHLGYQKAADIAKKAIKTGESVRRLILKEKLMDDDELNRILDPIHMTEPGISGKDYLIKK